MGSLFGGEAVVGFARVAVERGIDRFPEGLTYGVPVGMEGVGVGERVVVPLGRGDRATAGYVIETFAESALESEAVKLIARRDPDGVRLPPGLVELARWISGYYCAPIGVTIAGMLPAAVKRNVGRVARLVVDLAPDAPADVKLTPKQRGVVEVVAGLDAGDRPIEMRDLATRAGLRTTGPVRRLVERGVLAATRRTSVEATWAKHAVDARAPARLTDDQRRVRDGIEGRLDAGFSAHLVFGVTGSGKTEVYFRLIEAVLARGRTALLLVPEIALTPQTGGRLLGRFPDERVAVLHSGLTAAQRHQQWAMAADGTASIVLGARSAVFAPVDDARLGLIVVDEEHDASYKQDQTPRYHGRDVAVRRAQLAGCPVVLGSATPSLESWFNAVERGSYTLHRMPTRVPGMRMPAVRVVDFAEERRARRDRRVHLIGPTMEGALRRTLDRGHQALLLLNRRGYANYVACPDHRCGWVMTCDDCDVTVVYHKRDLPRADAGDAGYVQCHHCQTEQRLPLACPDCGRRTITFGLGTQRVEEELAAAVPALAEAGAMWRVDSDSMRSARDFHDVLGRYEKGVIRVLIGTQMIAKGLDFPGVRMVGVINADTAIHLPDFRSAERTFGLVSQVAGRCGRSSDPDGLGVVVVQSFHPTMPAIRLAADHDYESFASREIEERRRCGLPPIQRMARIVVRDADHERCGSAADALAQGVRGLAPSEVRVIGPAPCPIARIAGRHRRQVELLAPTAPALQRVLAAARSGGLIRSGEAMAVDVDPLALL